MDLNEDLRNLQVHANWAARATFGLYPPDKCTPRGLASAVKKAIPLLRQLAENVEAWHKSSLEDEWRACEQRQQAIKSNA